MRPGGHRVVVVGTGAAGVSVAEGLRRNGHAGEIVMIGAEHRAPYDRPPLSKQVLSGLWEPEKAELLSARRLEALDADWQLGCRVVQLVSDAALVVLDTGARIGFDDLVLATGVEPRRLPVDDLAGVHVLRRMSDAIGIKEALTPGRRLVVVGAGFLSLEVAATARSAGVEVTVVEPLAPPLADRLGPLVAGRLIDLHAERGVETLPGVGVEALVGDRGDPPGSFAGPSGEPGAGETVHEVRLTDGRALPADVVLVAIGCAPDLAWLADSGLSVDDGVVCDEFRAAAPGIWAAGDVARWMHPRFGRHIRIEHRTNANEQGQRVARNILGEPEPFAPIPFFWTDHYEVKIQLWGVADRLAEPEVLEGSPDEESFVLGFRQPAHGDLVGALGWNAARRMAAYKEEIASRW